MTPFTTKRITWPRLIRNTLGAVLVLTLNYVTVYWVRTGGFRPDMVYCSFYVIYISVWIAVALYSKNYKIFAAVPLLTSFKILTFHSFLTFLTLSLILTLFGLHEISRMFLLLVLLIPLLVQYLVTIGLTIIQGNWKIRGQTQHHYSVFRFIEGLGTKKVLVSLTLLLATSALWLSLRLGSPITYDLWQQLLSLLLLAWMLSAIVTGKFKSHRGQNFLYKIGPFIKSWIIMFLLLGALQYSLRQHEISRSLLFGVTLFYGAVEVLVFSIWFKLRLRHIEEYRVDGTIKRIKQRPLELRERNGESCAHSLGSALERHLRRLNLRQIEAPIELIRKHIAHEYLEEETFEVLFSKKIENVQVMDAGQYGVVLNLEPLNNMRYLNQYLIFCHRALAPGNFLMGCYEPLANVRANMRKRMPRFLFAGYYPLYFAFHRLLPKLPKIRHLYFVLTRGKGRNISRAEVLGRLSYCGFKTLEEINLDGLCYFVAQKLNTITEETHPSYGPVIGLERICLNGEIKRIYKFRTMHPYSEFIQKEIYETNNLDEIGKIRNDFRRTRWGLFLRKYWIDELPQIINWLKGDLNLVGVRALSEHFYSLYPDDLKALRIKFKPGLVPPFYADMPKTWDEIMDSERRYLIRKGTRPVVTDLTYFFKAFFNIFFRSARSM